MHIECNARRKSFPAKVACLQLNVVIDERRCIQITKNAIRVVWLGHLSVVARILDALRQNSFLSCDSRYIVGMSCRRGRRDSRAYTHHLAFNELLETSAIRMMSASRSECNARAFNPRGDFYARASRAITRSQPSAYFRVRGSAFCSIAVCVLAL